MEARVSFLFTQFLVRVYGTVNFSSSCSTCGNLKRTPYIEEGNIYCIHSIWMVPKLSGEAKVDPQ